MQYIPIPFIPLPTAPYINTSLFQCKFITHSLNDDLTNNHHHRGYPDFDGTIFMQDTGHILFDTYGCGAEARTKLDDQIKSGERSFRDVSEEMWGSLHVPFDDGFKVMEQTLEIDPGFREFYQYCVENGFPFNVLSAGLKPVLRRVLDCFLGEEEVRLPTKRNQI